MCSSIQFSSISSCSGVNPTAPSTPKPPALLTATTTSRQWVNAKIGNSMPSLSQMSVCMVSPGEGRSGTTGRRGEADRHGLDAVDEIAAEPTGLAGQLEVGHALDDFADHGLDLG